MKKKEKKESYVSLQKIHKDILLVTFNHGKPTDAEFDDYLKELKSVYLNFEESFIVIFDSRNVKYVASKFRQRQALWIKENIQLIRQKLILTIYVINNPVIRFVLEAIFLMQKSPVPYEIMSDFEAAEKRAMSFFEIPTD